VFEVAVDLDPEFEPDEAAELVLQFCTSEAELERASDLALNAITLQSWELAALLDATGKQTAGEW